MVAQTLNNRFRHSKPHYQRQHMFQKKFTSRFLGHRTLLYQDFESPDF